MTFIKRYWTTIFVVLVLSGFLGRHHFAAYRDSDPYDCSALTTHRFSPPYARSVPMIFDFFYNGLEVYVGGWIDLGTVTLEGDAITDPMTFKAEAGNGATRIAIAYIGEWYSSDFYVTFKPSADANCRVHVVYKFF